MKLLVFAAAFGAIGVGVPAAAQTYPDRPVRLIAPFAPGGSTDTVARILAARLTEQLGQSVIVDNRAGAGGTIGAHLVARAVPDGYTLLVGDFGPNVVAGALFSQLPYDPVKSFTHISLAVTFPLVLVTPVSSSIGSVKDYIDRARAKPATVRYGSAGVGTSPHVFMELFQFMAKAPTVHVPYKGGAPAVVGVMGGEVDSALVAVSSAIAQLSSGRLRALAVTSAAPSARLPGVPAVS
ncbi:MAG: tripartite tricarboxylate transporter substrate binding protein, partial [Proteobacteria bacterium]|nr:tripartite tricarboxylate transporter substrate binding protein [Burkholderiales bacterium]